MYLVVGANGYLGSYIIKAILKETHEKVVAVARSVDIVPDFDEERVEWKACDITDFEKVDLLNEYMKNKAENYKVVYLAAYHNPDLVARNPKIGWNVNVTCLSYFLNRMEGVERLFYPSSDSVYGDSVDGYHFGENDQLSPVNQYGRQKVIAETLVMGYGYNVIRYPFLIAPSILKHKKHFYDVIVDTIKQDKVMDMFSDSYRSSLDFGQASELLIKVMEKEVSACPPALNICGDDDLSKYDIGMMIADSVGVSRDHIRPVSIHATEQNAFETKRAASSLMDNTRLKELLGIAEVKIRL